MSEKPKKIEGEKKPECGHVWHFVERKVDLKSGGTTYLFHCVLCLIFTTRLQ